MINKVGAYKACSACNDNGHTKNLFLLINNLAVGNPQQVLAVG